MIKLANLRRDLGDVAAEEALLLMAAEVGELHAHNNLGLMYEDQRRWREAEKHYRIGAAGGDDVAAGNLERFLATYRRQLNRIRRRGQARQR